MTITSACNCGAIQFEVSVPVTDVYVCHCSICRRATGSNGIAVSVIPKEALTWTAGEDQIRTWRKPHSHWQIWFCGTCGSPIPGENDENTAFIPAGLLLNNNDAMGVAAHIWVESRAEWDVIGDAGDQFPEAFEG